MNNKNLILPCLLAVFALPALADEAKDKTSEAPEKPEVKVEPMHFESTGSVKIDGKSIEYTATAGTLVMKNEKDELKKKLLKTGVKTVAINY